MRTSMKIGGIVTGAVVLAAALAVTPMARHKVGYRLAGLQHKLAAMGTAEAQTHPAQGIDPNRVLPTVIGMNAGSPTYYSSEEVFADPIKSHGRLFWEGNQNRGELTNQVPLDDQLHPINVPAGSILSARIHHSEAPMIVGTYHCEISPGWRVEKYLSGGVTQSGTKFTVELPPKIGDPVQFAFTAEKNGASLTKLSCRYPGDKGNAVFRSDFLNDMKPFRVIRYMDWMVTNHAPKRLWAQRPTPDSMEQITNGVALEYMVQLSNELHSDPWFTLPMDTDPDYYRNFATYVRDHLDPNLKAYVELSNEVWNDGFQQAKDATERGKKLYPGVSDDKANDYYYADRVRDLMSIWSDVFKGQEKRIVRVMASQVWDQRSDQRLGHKDSWKYVDALAIAPYWGNIPTDVPGTGKVRVENLVAKIPAYINEAIGQAKANKIMAAKYGLPLIAYEGGPGLMAYDHALEDDIEAVEVDPRIYDLYQLFLTRWQKEIGGLLVLYQGTNATSFGHLRYTGQPLSAAPKMRAVVDFIHKNQH